MVRCARPTSMVDDLDGSAEDADTMRFSLDGTDFEIDLSRSNADRLRDKLARFVDSASPLHPRSARKPRTRVTRPIASGSDQTRAIRTWAIANGYQVSARGRVPKNVIEAFDVAH